MIYTGYAAPSAVNGWKPLNGSRGRRRANVPLQYGVVHLWVSPEDGPDRYLKQLATPALPMSGRTFQSRNSAGQWLWETPLGTQTTDPKQAKPYPGSNTVVYRSGSTALGLLKGDPMPWCYGAGYHCIAGIDGEFYMAVNPDDTAVNANPPWNDSAVSICMPGRYQTEAEWGQGGSVQEMEAVAKFMVYAFKRWGIPMQHITPADIRAGKKGWAGHVDVNNVYHQSDHGDPGPAFPWKWVIARTNKYMTLQATPQELQAVVDFWGWGTIGDAQKLFGVPVTNVWDDATADIYSRLIHFCMLIG